MDTIYTIIRDLTKPLISHLQGLKKKKEKRRKWIGLLRPSYGVMLYHDVTPKLNSFSALGMFAALFFFFFFFVAPTPN
jgi:hypothetical protein